jgi:hypothetical protein
VEPVLAEVDADNVDLLLSHGDSLLWKPQVSDGEMGQTIPLSDGVLRQGVQVRYAFVARERTRFPLDILCRLLEVSRSGFHDYLGRQSRPEPEIDAAIRRDLKQCHAESRRTYGRPRLVTDLREMGHAVGHKRVARLMREEGLRGKAKGRAKPRTTDSSHARPVAENLLDRQFDVTSLTPAWVSDITYIATREGWLYLAVVLSVQTRQVLGYSLSDRMPDDLVEQAFLNAWQVSAPQITCWSTGNGLCPGQQSFDVLGGNGGGDQSEHAM